MDEVYYDALPPPDISENLSKAEKKDREINYMKNVNIGLLPNENHFFEELILLKQLQIPKKKDKYKDMT